MSIPPAGTSTGNTDPVTGGCDFRVPVTVSGLPDWSVRTRNPLSLVDPVLMMVKIVV